MKWPIFFLFSSIFSYSSAYGLHGTLLNSEIIFGTFEHEYKHYHISPNSMMCYTILNFKGIKCYNKNNLEQNEQPKLNGKIQRPLIIKLIDNQISYNLTVPVNETLFIEYENGFSLYISSSSKQKIILDKDFKDHFGAEVFSVYLQKEEQKERLLEKISQLIIFKKYQEIRFIYSFLREYDLSIKNIERLTSLMNSLPESERPLLLLNSTHLKINAIVMNKNFHMNLTQMTIQEYKKFLDYFSHHVWPQEITIDPNSLFNLGLMLGVNSEEIIKLKRQCIKTYSKNSQQKWHQKFILETLSQSL